MVPAGEDEEDSDAETEETDAETEDSDAESAGASSVKSAKSAKSAKGNGTYSGQCICHSYLNFPLILDLLMKDCSSGAGKGRQGQQVQYTVKQRAVVRSGFEMTSKATGTSLKIGQTITATITKVNEKVSPHQTPAKPRQTPGKPRQTCQT